MFTLIILQYKVYCSSSQGVGSVQEDALQTVGALIEVVGNDFARYMQTFNPFLCQALENYSESSVSIIYFMLLNNIISGYVGSSWCCNRYLSGNVTTYIGNLYAKTDGTSL